ncbi:hypothetical protein FGIG_12240 [Fasciola gigantica]|uniref:Uncharacterized protein n=1 Tax=Fasciola gigantica TaxID=46835 RepID=A0A504YEY0_FASGI|nr:hypothetical protein FGIG_12240 [Fasciola gigantica]
MSLAGGGRKHFEPPSLRRTGVDFSWLKGYEYQLVHPHRNAVDSSERVINLYQLIQRGTESTPSKDQKYVT